MEQLRNLGQICRQHYEKIILSIALLLLGGAVLYFYAESKAASEKVHQIPVDFGRKAVNSVGPAQLTNHAAALKQAERPPGLILSGPHNLFNPVKWHYGKGGEKEIKIVHGDEVGPNAMRLSRVKPYHLWVAYDKVSTSSSSGETVVIGYWVNVTNESFVAARDLRKRTPSRMLSLNETNADMPLVLREVKGPPAEPTEFGAELIREQEGRFTFAPGKPFSKVIGHEAELRFPNSTNVTGFLRKGSDLTIDGQPYKIVDITSSEVVLSEDSNDKRYTITKFFAP